MVPSDVPPPSPGPAPRDGEERVRALLARAVEEQASEQRQLSDALTGLQQRVDAVAAQLRLAASGEAVGGGLAALGRQLQVLQAELGDRLGAVGSAVDTVSTEVERQGADGSAGQQRLEALALELQGSRAALSALGDAVGQLEPQVAGLSQLVTGGQDRVEGRLGTLADQQTLQTAVEALHELRSRPVEQVAPRVDLLLSAVRALPQTADLGGVVEDLVTALSARLDRFDGPLDDLRHRPAGDVLRPDLDAVAGTVRELPGRLDALAAGVLVAARRSSCSPTSPAAPTSRDLARRPTSHCSPTSPAAPRRGTAHRRRPPHRRRTLLTDVARRTDVEHLLTDLARRTDVEAAAEGLAAVLRELGTRPTAGPDDVTRAAEALHAHLATLPDRAAVQELLGGVARRDDLDGPLQALLQRPTAGPDDAERAAAGLHERLGGLAEQLAAVPRRDEVTDLLAPLPDRATVRALLQEALDERLPGALADVARRGDLEAGTAGVVEALTGRLDELAARPALGTDDLDRTVAGLHDRLGGLEQRPALAPDDLERVVGALLGRLPSADDVLGRLDAVHGRLGELDGQLDGPAGPAAGRTGRRGRAARPGRGPGGRRRRRAGGRGAGAGRDDGTPGRADARRRPAAPHRRRRRRPDRRPAPARGRPRRPRRRPGRPARDERRGCRADDAGAPPGCGCGGRAGAVRGARDGGGCRSCAGRAGPRGTVGRGPRPARAGRARAGRTGPRGRRHRRRPPRAGQRAGGRTSGTGPRRSSTARTRSSTARRPQLPRPRPQQHPRPRRQAVEPAPPRAPRPPRPAVTTAVAPPVRRS